MRSHPFLNGAAAGALLAALADPRSGKRRRRKLRDRTFALGRRVRRRTLRELRHERAELHGLLMRSRAKLPHEPHTLDDTTLAHKVETILFRDHEVPKGDLNVNAVDGVVYLRGSLADWRLAERISERVGEIEGVREVKNLIHFRPAQHVS
jgi:hypothetical protein